MTNFLIENSLLRIYSENKLKNKILFLKKKRRTDLGKSFLKIIFWTPGFRVQTLSHVYFPYL